jgi:hypothetical protein
MTKFSARLGAMFVNLSVGASINEATATDIQRLHDMTDLTRDVLYWIVIVHMIVNYWVARLLRSFVYFAPLQNFLHGWVIRTVDTSGIYHDKTLLQDIMRDPMTGATCPYSTRGEGRPSSALR